MIKNKTDLHADDIYNILCSCGKVNTDHTGHLVFMRIQVHVISTKNHAAEKIAGQNILTQPTAGLSLIKHLCSEVVTDITKGWY